MMRTKMLVLVLASAPALAWADSVCTDQERVKIQLALVEQSRQQIEQRLAEVIRLYEEARKLLEKPMPSPTQP